jgi:hypothetical protein
MYYHFVWRLPKLFRPFITFAQIAQLVFSTGNAPPARPCAFSDSFVFFAGLWHVNPDSCPALASFNTDARLTFLTPYIFVPVYTIFFVKFFFETYLCSKDDSKKEKGDAKADSKKD